MGCLYESGHGARQNSALVIFASNAYTQAIVPEVERLISPMRGESIRSHSHQFSSKDCTAQSIKLTPPPNGSDAFPPSRPSV